MVVNMKATKKKHQRIHAKKKDAKGTVRIQIFLADGAFYKKGNISKTMTVRDAKVSRIAKDIEEALFE